MLAQSMPSLFASVWLRPLVLAPFRLNRRVSPGALTLGRTGDLVVTPAVEDCDLDALSPGELGSRVGFGDAALPRTRERR